MLQQLTYALKRLLHSYPFIYNALFRLASLNRDSLRHMFSETQYFSRFGGLWTDADNFEDLLAHKIEGHQISDEDAEIAKQFRQDGYVILESAIPHSLIDDYLNELSTLKQNTQSGLLLTSANHSEPHPYSSEVEANSHSVRTVDDYFFLQSSRNILFHKRIHHTIELFFERPGMLTQSLSFTQGSEQGMHRDTSFVRMNSPIKLLGIWIALEDVAPGSGELIYFPGSHSWPDYLYSGYFKHYDQERDGEDALDDNYRWLYQQAADRGVSEKRFSAKKGDVLIWHADLAHGGAPVTNRESTRKSLVGHFCPEDVSPLYVYYKPKYRRRYTDNGRCFMTSYYR